MACMQRPLGSFPLSSGHVAKLSSAGFKTAQDLKDVGIIELSRELSVSHNEALEIITVVMGKTTAKPGSFSSDPTRDSTADRPSSSCAHTPTGRSALEMLKAERLQGYVVTFCAKLDSMLGGGVPLGKITEFCGAPGTGKTQLSLQLAVDVSIPEVFGGIGGEAVYIDTEGSFIVERVVDIAAAAVQHLSSVAESSEDPEMPQAASALTVERVLSGIHYFRCHDYLELVALVNILPEFIAEHPKVRLVAIDSIACPFRHDFDDMGLRSRILSGIAQNLIRMATQSNLAVVLTNQMTTKVSYKSGKSSQLVPALGESWGHASTIRVVLCWSGGERLATLYKSPSLKEATVPYQITQHGVRDIPPYQSSQEPSTLGEPSLDSISLTSSQVEALEQRSDAGSAVLAELEGSWGSGDGVSDFLSVSELQQCTASARETALSRGGVLTGRTRKRPRPEVEEYPVATLPKSLGPQ